MKIFLITAHLLLSLNCFSSGFIITEEKLQSMSQESNPSLSEIEATFLSSRVNLEQMQDKFGYEAYSAYSHQNTNEAAQINFQPVFNNINQYKVGVKKYTKYGVVLDLNTSVDQRSGASDVGSDFKNIHTTIHSFGVQMDLWKDFMGEVTKANFDNLSDIKKKDELQEKISKSVLKNNIRRLYWSLVANKQKLKYTTDLYNTALKQVKISRRKKASSVSDKAEVARFESLVHQRKGQLLFLEYEQEALFKQLRDFFPQLNGKELKLGSYNLDQTVFKVLECSQRIGSQDKVPYDHTSYDEIISLLKTVKSRQGIVDKSYDDIDIKLDLAVRQVGVSSNQEGNDYEGSFQNSLDDIANNDRSAMSASVMVTIPFGEDLKGTTAVKEALTEKQFDANINSMQSNVISTHEQVKKSVRLLTQVIREQRSNSKQLAIRVKEMKKKYSQARIPEYALIQDEDSLLQSDIAIVDTQLRVVNTILDYVSVFNSFPCSFNK